MRKFLHFLITSFIITSLFSCDKEDTNNEEYSFQLESKFDSIRSCPGGGGLFIIKLNNTDNQTEKINLQLASDKKLNATLTKNHVSSDQSVFEILIKPDKDISISDYQITVTGERKSHINSVKLNVSIIDWESSSELGEIITRKKTAYVKWLNNNYPDININNQTDWDIYTTYPQIIIVEHITLLNDSYEMRICNHATIHPHDWSMIRLRERNTFEPFLAARQDSTDGLIYQIPLEEYPLLFDYY